MRMQEALLEGTDIYLLQSVWMVERFLARGTRMNLFGITARVQERYWGKVFCGAWCPHRRDSHCGGSGLVLVNIHGE